MLGSELEYMVKKTHLTKLVPGVVYLFTLGQRNIQRKDCKARSLGGKRVEQAMESFQFQLVCCKLELGLHVISPKTVLSQNCWPFDTLLFFAWWDLC